MKSAHSACDRVAKMFICALHMPVNTHTCSVTQRAASVGGVLDDVAKSASATAAGRAPTAKSRAARAVQVVPAPQKGVTERTDPRRPTWAGHRGDRRGADTARGRPRPWTTPAASARVRGLSMMMLGTSILR